MSEQDIVYASNSRCMEGANNVYQIAHDQSSAWGNDSSSIIIRQYWDGGAYRISRSFLYFDLAGIIPAGAIILSAILHLKVQYINPDYYYPIRPPFDCVIQKSVTEDRPLEPPELSDFNYLYYSGDYGRKNTSSMEEDVWTEIEITDLSLIIAGDMTKFAIRNDNEINNIPPSTGSPHQMESVIFYPYDAAEGNKPYIVIEWINPLVINVKAEINTAQSAIKLYGEILSVEAGTIVERGFEYKIQDNEPGEEDTGIEVKEINAEGFGIGEYSINEYEGNEIEFEDRLYHLLKDEGYEHDIIWWFRAYIKDSEDNKYIAETWMKNIPTVTTSECTNVYAQEATGNGELIDKGANIVTRRGFRIIKEYSGDLMGANEYCSPISDYKVAEGLQEHTIYDAQGIFITGFYWTGIFYRDAIFPKSITPGNFDLGIYLNVLGGGFMGEGFGYYLKPNDTLKIQAIAKNDLGVGYGDDIFEITTGQNLLYEPDPPVISPTSVEKSVTLRNIPEGAIATRVGIRLGRTSSCNEIDVFEDGEWGNDDKVTFFITDLEPGEKYYEEPYMVLKYIDSETGEEWEEEIIDEEEEPFEIPEWDEDWDYDTTISTYEEYNYKTVIREIICEKMSDQSFIDKAGRKRSITLVNHLIQTEEVNREVINDYLNKFQIIKLKVSIDYDIPIPFERGDVILIGEGKYKFKANGEGEIPFKIDEEGEISFANSILTKIRKIDSNFTSGIETILGLELEV